MVIINLGYNSEVWVSGPEWQTDHQQFIVENTNEWSEMIEM